MSGELLGPLPSAPFVRMLTRLVLPLTRSCTKTSVVALLSLGTRLEAADAKATKRPVAEIAGEVLDALPSTPPVLMEAREVWGAATAAPASQMTTTTEAIAQKLVARTGISFRRVWKVHEARCNRRSGANSVALLTGGCRMADARAMSRRGAARPP